MAAGVKLRRTAMGEEELVAVVVAMAEEVAEVAEASEAVDVVEVGEVDPTGHEFQMMTVDHDHLRY